MDHPHLSRLVKAQDWEAGSPSGKVAHECTHHEPILTLNFLRDFTLPLPPPHQLLEPGRVRVLCWSPAVWQTSECCRNLLLDHSISWDALVHVPNIILVSGRRKLQGILQSSAAQLWERGFGIAGWEEGEVGTLLSPLIPTSPMNLMRFYMRLENVEYVIPLNDKASYHCHLDWGMWTLLLIRIENWASATDRSRSLSLLQGILLNPRQFHSEGML